MVFYRVPVKKSFFRFILGKKILNITLSLNFVLGLEGEKEENQNFIQFFQQISKKNKFDGIFVW
jgi:hypothetical protein